MNSLTCLKKLLLCFSVLLLVSCGGSSSDGDSGKSNVAQDKIEAFAENGNTAPTVQDYMDAGVTGVNADNLDEINSIIKNLSSSDVDTKEEIQALADKLGLSYNCQSTQHKENGLCISNTKSVSCAAPTIPDNASIINTQVEITWENDSWSEAQKCEWSCNNGYQKDGDACVVSTSNQAPIANAGNDQTVAAGVNVTLTSTSTDNDGTITAWEWKEGTTVLSTQESFSKDDFSVGTHNITLTVTDNKGANSNDSIVITITNNNTPVANAGEDQTVLENTVVTLDASDSSDDGGTISSWKWEENSTLLSTQKIFTKNDFSVGVHTLKLTVTDNDGATNSDTVVITITEKQNSAPMANAGPDKTASPGTNITFNASASTDSDGSITNWKWEEGSTPLSTAESFSKNNFSIGTHTITLTVTDNEGATDKDTVIVFITGNSNHTVSNSTEASNFLNRATFGPTKNSITSLINNSTYENWLNQQFNAPATLHLPRVDALATKMCANIDDEGGTVVDSWEITYARHQIWWEAALNADDQLRQRMAFALSEIMVVSDSEGLGLSGFQRGVTSYYDLFVKHAFGNFRDLLDEVTLHPAMGDFLSLTRNQKENIEEGIRPDENYAREVLQLFTIGVHELNQDGSEKLDNSGQPIPTYNQGTIEEFAKVFTGWGYSDIDWYGYFGEADHTLPLKAYEEFHDTSEKTLLRGAISPANKTAREDLTFALDNIFNHPNVAPFISAQLIQRLVTSNPSSSYIERVASIFNNNGQGVRGDLKAVAKAILLDEEALSLSKSPSFGKLREPLLRISHLWRNFPIQAVTQQGHYWEPENTCGQGTYTYYRFWDSLDDFANKIGQGPLQARSVFNFFRPDHSPNGTLNSLGLKAPEFQIINENTYVGLSNLLYYMVTEFSDANGISDEVDVVSDDFAKLDLNYVTTLAQNHEDLLNYLSLTLLNNKMTTTLKNILLEHLNQDGVFPDGVDGQFVRAREAILLIISSPEYLIQQ